MLLLNGVPVVPTVFPDKTSQVWKLDQTQLSKNGSASIQWLFENEAELFHLAQLTDLLFANKITYRLVLNYLPYGRQDKEVSNDATFALRTFAYIINSLGFEEIVIVDPHSQVALDIIHNSRAHYPHEMLELIMLNSKVNLVCYPDKGALTKYSKVYDLEVGSSFIYGEKVRDQSTGNITHYEVKGECDGDHVLIVDDICDGGATFKILTKSLLEKGAASVSLFVTHGIFSRGLETLYESGIKEIYTAQGNVRANKNLK